MSILSAAAEKNCENSYLKVFFPNYFWKLYGTGKIWKPKGNLLAINGSGNKARIPTKNEVAEAKR